MVASASRSDMSSHMPLMTMVAGLAKRVGGFHLLVNDFRFGGEGNLEDWWSNNTATEFHKRAECLVRTYTYVLNSQFSYNWDLYIHMFSIQTGFVKEVPSPCAPVQ